MKPYLRYFWYVLKHKYFVFIAGLKTGAPIWRLIVHDLSKFRLDEFIPYAQYFYDDGLKKREDIDSFLLFSNPESAPFGYFVKDRFNMAWLLHQRRNPHHWQWWYLVQDNDPSTPIPMPESFIREMVADWAGAGRTITGGWTVAEWYNKNKDKIQLHPDTRELVEMLIGIDFAVTRERK